MTGFAIPWAALPPGDRPRRAARHARTLTGVNDSRCTGLLVLDVDSTFLHEEVIELIAEAAGTRDEVARVTEAAMRGELDFTASLERRVATLEGVPESVFADVAARVTVRDGAAELIEAAHGRDWRVALVSGGFHEVVDVIAGPLGVDHVTANRLEVADGHLTGRTVGEVVDRDVKRRTLLELVDRWAVDPRCTIAVGDGANDLDMLAAAELGIALNAKPVVAEAADLALEDATLFGVLDALRRHAAA